MPFTAARDRIIEPAAHLVDLGARLTAALAASSLPQNSLHTQLRSQSAALEHLEAENADQGATIKSLQTEIGRLRTIQQTDAQDLVHLASRLLVLAQATGGELDNTAKELFHRRGWVNAVRKTEAKQP